MIDEGSNRVRWKGVQNWKSHFCLTGDRISLLARRMDSDQDEVKVWTYPILGGGKVLKAVQPLLEVVVAKNSPEFPQFRHSTLISISHTSSGVLLVHQSAFTPMTTLSLYSNRSGEMLLSICWTEDITMVLSTTGSSQALLRSSTNSTLMLFSLQSGEVVQTWQEADLNKELDIAADTSWSEVFDIGCQAVS